jgi:hypothetical protein
LINWKWINWAWPTQQCSPPLLEPTQTTTNLACEAHQTTFPIAHQHAHLSAHGLTALTPCRCQPCCSPVPTSGTPRHHTPLQSPSDRHLCCPCRRVTLGEAKPSGIFLYLPISVTASAHHISPSHAITPCVPRRVAMHAIFKSSRSAPKATRCELNAILFATVGASMMTTLFHHPPIWPPRLWA